MHDLASGVADGLDRLAADGPRRFDLFGRLTGSIVAIELAATRPDLVRRVVLGAVPYFSGAAQAEMYEKYAVGYQQPVPEDGSHLQRYWESIVSDRRPGVSMADATEVFLDLIRAKDVHWWGYHAVFTHDTKGRATRLSVPVIILDYENPFSKQERELAADLRDVRVLPMPDHDRQLTGEAAERIANALRLALDPPPD